MQRSCWNFCNSLDGQWCFCAVLPSYIPIVVARPICRERPTHDQQQNGQAKHTLVICGILTPGVSSKHRSDQGGKPKVDASQMLPRCFLDVSQFPPYLWCIQGAPDEIPGVNKKIVFLLLKNDMQNRRKKLTESLLILAVFRAVFHRKSCARGVFVRMPFFVNLLTVSGRLDPRSARAGAVETQFLNLRVTAKQM